MVLGSLDRACASVQIRESRDPLHHRRKTLLTPNDFFVFPFSLLSPCSSVNLDFGILSLCQYTYGSGRHLRQRTVNGQRLVVVNTQILSRPVFHLLPLVLIPSRPMSTPIGVSIFLFTISTLVLQVVQIPVRSRSSFVKKSKFCSSSQFDVWLCVLQEHHKTTEAKELPTDTSRGDSETPHFEPFSRNLTSELSLFSPLFCFSLPSNYSLTEQSDMTIIHIVLTKLNGQQPSDWNADISATGQAMVGESLHVLY